MFCLFLSSVSRICVEASVIWIYFSAFFACMQHYITAYTKCELLRDLTCECPYCCRHRAGRVADHFDTAEAVDSYSTCGYCENSGSGKPQAPSPGMSTNSAPNALASSASRGGKSGGLPALGGREHTNKCSSCGPPKQHMVGLGTGTGTERRTLPVSGDKHSTAAASLAQIQ